MRNLSRICICGRNLKANSKLPIFMLTLVEEKWLDFKKRKADHDESGGDGYAKEKETEQMSDYHSHWSGERKDIRKGQNLLCVEPSDGRCRFMLKSYESVVELRICVGWTALVLCER